MGPLAGLKVIEFAHIMAGPVCGLMLADMGADVIKVEKVPGGDDTRRSVPPEIEGESAAFLMMNRNKRGIAIDLKTEGGREAAKKLIASADVVTENYRKGTMERLGIGYDEARKINPGVIYAELSGFGRTGPYADRAGFDLIAQGMSGLMSVTGAGPGHAPMKCGVPLTDITAGILAAMGILGACIHRLKTGEGQRIDTSLFEAGIVHTYWQSAIGFATGVSPGPMGSAHPLNAPYQAFATADGWITVGAANQANWLKLLDALEAPEIGEDARFSTNDGRMGHLEALVGLLGPIFSSRSSADWLARFERAGVPAGPVLDILGMQQDPQTIAREMVIDVPHAKIGRTRTLGHPVKYSATPADIRRGAPGYGEHTAEVLREIGMDEGEIADLIRQKSVLAA